MPGILTGTARGETRLGDVKLRRSRHVVDSECASRQASDGRRPTCLPGKVVSSDRNDAAGSGKKRKVKMSERKLLFLMNAEQAEAFTRLVQAEHGGGDAACRLRDMYGEGLGGLSRPPWRRLIHNAPASTISRRDRLGRIPKAGDRPFSANRMTDRLWPAARVPECPQSRDSSQRQDHGCRERTINRKERPYAGIDEAA